MARETRTVFDDIIRRHVSTLLTARNARTIAAYWPFDGEVDLTPLCRQMMVSGYLFALPVISSVQHGVMNFHAWVADTDLVNNRYDIPEPQDTARVPLSTVDIMLMPLVAYDQSGTRLGMGAGYYDRCLEPLRASARPLRVGIAYSLQEMDAIDCNRWDIPLHGVVNEHGWRAFVDQRLADT